MRMPLNYILCGVRVASVVRGQSKNSNTSIAQFPEPELVIVFTLTPNYLRNRCFQPNRDRGKIHSLVLANAKLSCQAVLARGLRTQDA